MLQGKTAVIYGGGGSIGSAVARAFALEGAKVHLTGPRRASLEVAARSIAGAEVAEVDACDPRAVDAHLERIGRVDVSFNAVGVPDERVIGVPLAELPVERFVEPLLVSVQSFFVSAAAAARRMVAQRSGVIMTITSLHARTGIPLVGGYGPAMAAKEALVRGLSAELAPSGVRVVGLRPQAMPETPTIRRAFEPRARALGLTWEQWQARLASRTHPGRLMTLDELAQTAVYVASPRAAALTGTIVNLTMGSLDD